jgi:hypothetical protein
VHTHVTEHTHAGHRCGTDCGLIVSERNRYFTGKYMAARDFRDEQEYLLNRHRLHQRLLHGWGVVCGLRVRRHPDPRCADRWVVIGSGIALDCCGRELVLCKDTPVRLPLPWPENRAAGDETGPPEPDTAVRGDADAVRGPLVLCLRYQEQDIELVPALYHEGVCDSTRREPNRVREVADIEIFQLHDLDPDCWQVPEYGPHAPCRDDCDDELPGPGGSCLDPHCACGERVPLALISFDPENSEKGFEIDTRGRRTLPTPPPLLTHIVDLNWAHGGEITLADLATKHQRRLEVRFDRRLQPSPGPGLGINEHTFVVQFGGIDRDLEFIPPDPAAPPTVEDGCVAVFTLDPSYTAGKGRSNIAGNTVFVTLRCDFILDCHENPVDGDFLRASWPTGNGLPGGLFESWFRVV